VIPVVVGSSPISHPILPISPLYRSSIGRVIRDMAHASAFTIESSGSLSAEIRSPSAGLSAEIRSPSAGLAICHRMVYRFGAAWPEQRGSRTWAISFFVASPLFAI
jgi:hypothetical protein